ncbi:MAG: hypothetical protein Q4D13_01280 [Erysipelotrichaceae bacterium]|nr:hypothetical protein [Erysipelotrichaceae bacterium]
MNFKQYRTLDLCIFIAMYAICEFLVIKSATVWFVWDEMYSISIMLLLLLIVMMRWDKYCIFQAVISSILFVAYQSGSVQQYIIYLAGNLGFMLTLIYVSKVGKDKIRNSIFLTMGYVVIGYLLMELSRGLAAVIVSGVSVQVISVFVFTDMLTLVFTLVGIFIARKVEGLFMDQKQYLIQLKENEEDENFDDYDSINGGD